MGRRSFALRDEIESGLASDCFNASSTRRDGHFGDDLDHADFAGGGDVGATAEFTTVATDIDDADNVTVLIAEEGEGAFRLFVELGFVGLHRRVIDDLFVYELFDLANLRRCHGLEMREVETHPLRRF